MGYTFGTIKLWSEHEPAGSMRTLAARTPMNSSRLDDIRQAWGASYFEPSPVQLPAELPLIPDAASLLQSIGLPIGPPAALALCLRLKTSTLSTGRPRCISCRQLALKSGPRFREPATRSSILGSTFATSSCWRSPERLRTGPMVPNASPMRRRHQGQRVVGISGTVEAPVHGLRAPEHQSRRIPWIAVGL